MLNYTQQEQEDWEQMSEINVKGINELAALIYKDNKAKGFWDTLDNLLAEGWKLNASEMFDNTVRSVAAEKIALMHSELSEALEAVRKDLMDDKLPKYRGEYVELADALIRILDYMGRTGVDFETIIKEKLEYNRSRPHKHGKAF